ncbi:polysaccharide pyruvyl transferase family protein [Acinetobacter terrestris]|uniref:polysaccharide pyruvyl transferase family protein n=1 Tax=Acinetobacter terrestris TaxID=2529843 RepID=UPI00103915D0|nr:polysaccharide pyruvyl transferase family protein [Acinetobacter terrestris]TCB46546.1 polysaccharide pyruvyl transferase family protein [Acinetobacter terrestris]
MTKKIAILTQPLHVNFGGTLQAFALQKKIVELGYEVQTINYQWKKISDLKKIFSVAKHKILSNKFAYPFFDKELRVLRSEHTRFITSNINYSPILYSVKDLKKYFEENNFDAVVVGSDQVWRVAYSPRIESFFLDFLTDNNKIRKVAYSASFGIEEWQFEEQKTYQIKALVSGFNAISVREESAVDICRNYLDLEAEHTLDPTLLLEAQDYLRLFDLEGLSEKREGIFTYVLDKDLKKKNMIDAISKKMNKKIFMNQPKNNIKNSLFIKDFESYIYPSIENWIKAFHEADFVITDSFHGTVFSIIFNKPFISIVNQERGASRFDSLLGELNLSDRMVNNINDINDELINSRIDYESINNKIIELREKSLGYLKRSLI